MKNKIAKRLILYFIISLTTFSIIVGTLFSYLFKKHSAEIYKTELEKRAYKISKTMEEYIIDFKSQIHKKGSGYGAYMKFLDQIAMANIWIVDSNKDVITYSIEDNETVTINSGELDKAVSEGLKGNKYVVEDIKSFKEGKIIISEPIKSGEEVLGTVVLESDLNISNTGVKDGIKTLVISILISLVISGGIVIALSMRFIKPLKRMKETANLLADGDYTAKTRIKQNDEIGDLANTIDLLSNRLNEASKESEKLEKMRIDFVANISHELRTPVTVIRGSLEAICDGIVNGEDEVKEYNKQMLEETIYLQRLVNDLLDLSRLQNTDFKIEMEELNFGDVLEDVTRSMSRLVKEKNISILKEYKNANFKIIGDYSRLRQMLIIIIDNAIKYSEDNSDIKIIVKDEIETFSISVLNKGEGIKKEDINYIFDRFYRTRYYKNNSGTGLGLSIAKGIANRHNIKINVYSEEEKYTEFKFKINKII